MRQQLFDEPPYGATDRRFSDAEFGSGGSEASPTHAGDEFRDAVKSYAHADIVPHGATVS
jgi:hypothetical protein